MKSGVFQDAVESSTKVFGRKNDVHVVFEGGTAKTDGNTVYLPSLPPSAEVSLDQANVIRGYRDHESLHIRMTDTQGVGLRMLKDLEKQGNKHHTAILQYCEDARIENGGTQEYPGMKESLTATNTHAAKMLLEQIEQRGKAEDVLRCLPDPLKFRMMLSNMSRAAFGVGSGGIYEAINEHIKADKPALYDLAAKWAKRMTDLPTGYADGKLDEVAAKAGTLESFKLAQEVFNAYSDYEMEPPPPPPPEGGDGGENGGGEGNGLGSNGDGSDGDEDDGTQGSGDSDSDDDGDGEGGGQGDGGQPGDGGNGGGDGQADGDDGEDGGSNGGDGTTEQGEGHDSNPASQPKSQGGGGNSNSDNTPTETPGENANAPDIDTSGIDIDDMFSKALDDVVGDITDASNTVKPNGTYKGMFRVYSNRLSVKAPIVNVMAACNGDSLSNVKAAGSKRFVGMKKAVDGKKAMIRRILELELMARSDRHWESGHKSGRLQSVRLVQAIQGRETVYQKRHDGKDMDTLLCISIDSSGSMDGQRQTQSAVMAFALSDALERTGCDIEVSLWGDAMVPEIKNIISGSGYTHQEMSKIYNSYRDEMNDIHRRGLKLPYVSVGLITRAVVKGIRQRMSDPAVQQGFGAAMSCMQTGTPSLNAIFADLTDMSKQSHSKKIYLHLTDGVSNHPDSGQPVKELMDEAHKFAKSIGVHMIGVGISGAQVDHMFPDNVVVRGSDAYEPVVKHLAKLIAAEGNHAKRRAA